MFCSCNGGFLRIEGVNFRSLPILAGKKKPRNLGIREFNLSPFQIMGIGFQVEQTSHAKKAITTHLQHAKLTPNWFDYESRKRLFLNMYSTHTIVSIWHHNFTIYCHTFTAARAKLSHTSIWMNAKSGRENRETHFIDFSIKDVTQIIVVDAFLVHLAKAKHLPNSSTQLLLQGTNQ